MLTKLLRSLTGARPDAVRRSLAQAHRAREAGRHGDALQIALEVAAREPRLAEARGLAGACRVAIARGRHADAVRARACPPDSDALYAQAAEDFAAEANLAGQPCAAIGRQAAALRESGRLEASQALLLEYSASPDCDDATGFQAERALGLLCTGQSGDARAIYQHLLAREPENARLHAAYALALLGDGEFARGWDEYEWRLKLEPRVARLAPDAPLWAGEPLGGRSILVEAEQGLGDQIMFASCLPDLERAGAVVAVEVSPRLVSLFRHSFPGIKVLPKGSAPDALPWRPDFRVAFGSLPLRLRRSAEDFPISEAYLCAPPELVAEYRARLAALGPGPKIGIAWRGGLPETLGALRSMPLAALAPVTSLSGARFVSLELADCRAEINAAGLAGRVAWWDEAPLDMARFAALLTALDGVVSVATTAVHLAGALGRPVWALVSRAGTWRYLWQGEHMPWYSSVQVLRPAGSMDSVCCADEVAKRLCAKLGLS